MKPIAFFLLWILFVNNNVYSQQSAQKDIFDDISAISVSLLKHQKNPYLVKSLRFYHRDLQEAEKYDFTSFSVLRSVELESDPEHLIELINKISLLPALKVLKITEIPLYAPPDKKSMDLTFPEEIKKLKGIEALKLNWLKNYNWQDVLYKISELPSINHLSINISFFDSIPENLLRLKNIEALEISGNDHILVIPSWLKQFHKLGYVDISSNTKLDYSQAFHILSTLPSLRSINLKYGNFDTFPSSITSLKKLEQLYLDGLKLKNHRSLFSAISMLKNLKRLEINHGDSLEIDPEIGKLNKLEYFSFNNKKCNSIPIEIGKLKRLKNLSVWSNNLSTLPDEIRNLKNLEELAISGNRLQNLPEGLSKLFNLKHLDLYGNQLSFLPENIGELVQLKKLYVSRNSLTSFPKSITKCINLEELIFSGNKVTSLPGDIQSLRSLKKLEANINSIDNIPKGIGSINPLTIIDLSNNLIKFLPDEICNLKNLQTLSLFNNSLQELPKYFGQLTSLNELNLGSGLFYNISTKKATMTENNNKFRGLPSSFSNLKNLKILRLDNSIISNGDSVIRIIQKLQSKTERIQLTNCSVNTLPDSGWEKSEITYLDLGNNNISSIPVSILKAPALNYLRFTGNKLPPAFNTSFDSKELLTLTALEEGLIKDDSIVYGSPAMCTAFLKAGNNHYYKKNYPKTQYYYNLAEKKCPEIRNNNNWRNDKLGIALYYQKEYKKASQYLLAALQNDTSGMVRIMNSIEPEFEYLSKSYFALRDTTEAINILQKWATSFYSSAAYTTLGIVYLNREDTILADKCFQSAVKQYRDFGIKNTLNLLSILEVFVMNKNKDSISQFINKTDTAAFTTAEKLLLSYLVSTSRIQNNNLTDSEFDAIIISIEKNAEQKANWSYELFESWLNCADLNENQRKSISLLNETIKKIVHN